MENKEIKKDFPSNTNKEKEVVVKKKTMTVRDTEDQGNNPREVSKIVEKKVTRKKKSIFEKFFNVIGDGEDTRTVSDYVIWDVIVPNVKDAISEAISGGIDMLLFGDTKGSRTKRNKGVSRVNNYNSIYARPGYHEPPRSRAISPSRRARHSFDNLVFESRGEAEEVLSRLVDMIDQYGVATVDDFYSLSNITGDYTDRDYGWTDLSRSVVERVRNGYTLRLPKTEVLD